VGELRTSYLIAADTFIVHAIDSEGPRVLYIGAQPPEDIEFRPS
jgi:hypothetical protein